MSYYRNFVYFHVLILKKNTDLIMTYRSNYHYLINKKVSLFN